MSKANDNTPLYLRLAEMEAGHEPEEQRHKGSKKRKLAHSEEAAERKIGRANKNAPAEMMSNKPVRRLRIDANNAVKKSVDPRFSDISGKMDEKIFNHNYAFLDEYRSDEIKQLSGIVRKVKSEPKKQAMKAELVQMKQQASERRRGLKVVERMEAIKAEEREKVKQGKKPFYMKSAAIKAVGLEEKYSELKREGKLNKFMNKKRKKNSNKDHRWMPTRRQEA